MLILRRKEGESIVIGGNIRVEVAEIAGNQVKLVIDAPREVPIHRQEVWEAIRREMKEAAEASDFSPTGGVPSLPSAPGPAGGSGLIVEDESCGEEPPESRGEEEEQGS